MDSVDCEILDCLKKNSRISVSKISNEISLSVPAVSERIKKLEEKGIIEGYMVKVNRKLMDQKLLVMIFVNIDHSKNIVEFRKKVQEYEEVLEVYHIVGDFDYLLKVLLRDTDELEDFITEKLKRIKGVQSSKTTIVLSTLKEEINR